MHLQKAEVFLSWVMFVSYLSVFQNVYPEQFNPPTSQLVYTSPFTKAHRLMIQSLIGNTGRTCRVSGRTCVNTRATAALVSFEIGIPDSMHGNTGERFTKLDESTARRQLKSPRSLSDRSIHLTLVTKWSWSWSWMTYCHSLCAMSVGPPILRYSYFKIWPWKSMVKVMCAGKGEGHVWPSKFKGRGYGQGQTHWSHLRPGVQSICLLFVLWQSDHFWLRYRKFLIWPWKFKVKVMAKVKSDGHIWGLEFNWYVWFFVS